MEEYLNGNYDQEQLLIELRQVNERLLESERLKSNFLSNIRNEIVNPLTSILGLSSSLSSNSRDPESVEKFSGLIYQEAFNLDFQIRNIYAAAEIEAGTVGPEISNIEVGKLLEQILDRLEHLIKKKLITINRFFEFPEDLVFCSDASKINLILLNILINAIEYSEENGHIDLHIFFADGKLHLKVKDYGPGIDKEDQEKIFNRFRQLEFGSTKRHKGHGLGLSVASSFLEIIGGVVELESDLGLGSTFMISINETNGGIDLNEATAENEFLFNQEEIRY